MSYSSNARCVNCGARNPNCNGCQACAGIEYGSDYYAAAKSAQYTASNHIALNAIGSLGIRSAEKPSSPSSIANTSHQALVRQSTLPVEHTRTWPYLDASIAHDSRFQLAEATGTSSPLESDTRLAFLDDVQSPEIIQQGILDRLVPDETVNSNMLTYLTYSAASWMSRFLFEPVRSIQGTKSPILHWLKHDTGQVMIMAKVGLSVAKDTEYDLSDFFTWEKMVVEGVLQARERGVRGPEAMEALRHCHKVREPPYSLWTNPTHKEQFISTLTKVGSLASVLGTMNLFAPVFRLACPEPATEYVNLPQTLLGNVNLQYFATLDVLQSTLTHRPMFFRYDLQFRSPRDEALVHAEDGPGFKVRWLYGIPDRLVVTLARMNTLLEDFGNRVGEEVVRDLEAEIEASVPAGWSSVGVNPLRILARMLVDESWKFAAYVYLYMGLGGANAHDKRVVQVQNKFMRLLSGVEPRRNPDSFLVMPMVILGIATSDPEQQSALLARLWGVSECSQSGTMGNDLLRMVKDVWARTRDRPAVWSDLGIASSSITRM
ncbi:unnamed protein product [Rhizoctonia solani]|uniref:Uncharacterized protein n=1 Tax=Rhizoctonia solani TaxID=456999 RepID=A0A8H3HFG8_9AGAM|nr:unnamed protein product [Rhizoctonia solani]